MRALKFEILSQLAQKGSNLEATYYLHNEKKKYRVAIKEWPPRNVAAAKNWSFGSESINNKNCSLYL